MKTLKTFFLVWSVLATLEVHGQSLPTNALTAKEKKDGWKLLFDGMTMKGWRNFNSAKIGSAWKVQDGLLYLDASLKNGKRENGGDIITEKEYENYELNLEWKIEPCGNSGIIFNVVDDPKYEHTYTTGPEMQILDNTCHPDGKIIKHRAGNLYDLVESKTESVRPAGEWNQVRILSNKGHLELWLNAVKQVDIEMFTPEWEALIKTSKFKSMPDFGKAKKGHIALQDHGNQVWFRNIKIKEL
jgi:cytochrome c